MTTASQDSAAAGTYLLEVILPVPLDRTFTYRLAVDAASDEPPGIGTLVGVPFGRRREVPGLIVGARTAAGQVTEIEGVRLRNVGRVFPDAYGVRDDRRALLDWMAEYYGLPPGEVLPLFHPPSPQTKARRSRHLKQDYPAEDTTGLIPTAAQLQALEHVDRLLESREFGTILLHGVTGSGKTEVYLRAISRCLDADRGAIVLLPEIALTPQTEARIAGRFGDLVATLHSALSAGERCRVHEAAAAGDVRVVVGPRSALFSPIRDLGVVVVDEEHETSYKQDEKPRYHARHAALVRARAAGAAVLLGSATPDLESYRNAQEGRYRLIEMRDRPVGCMPSIEVVDMRSEPASDGFSARLLSRIESTLSHKRQAIIYHNRRGFARAVQCTDCGEPASCPRCDIGLTLHLRPRRLLCHYCGFVRAMPETCDACGGTELNASGSGTEKAELVLEAQFPGVRLARLDHDTTRRRGSHARILSSFATGEADLLIGTQMVAKGHHFPGVNLVGVLAADDGLLMPDFRAQERTFQLLTQVAGRTGREDPGQVIFQTWQPDHPVILAASAQDYESFSVAELAHRNEIGYPPFLRMVRIGLSGRRLGEVESVAESLSVLLRKHLQGPELTVLGPAPAVFARLQNRHRQQLLLKGAVSNAQKGWLASCLRTIKGRHRGVDLLIDVDPLGMW